MAGIVAYYFVGGGGGFQGADGMGNCDFVVEVGAGSREWLSLVKYLSYNHKPISVSVKTMIPTDPYDKDRARRMLILWASDLFESCPSFELVKKEIEGTEFVDFHMGYGVPEHFNDLLEESRTIDLNSLINVYFAPLSDIDMNDERKYW